MMNAKSIGRWIEMKEKMTVTNYYLLVYTMSSLVLKDPNGAAGKMCNAMKLGKGTAGCNCNHCMVRFWEHSYHINKGMYLL